MRTRDFKGKKWIPTEVLVEEGERGQVAAQAEELGHHHEPVPGTDRQRHHQQFGQDERCEGDGDHVHELRLKQHQRAVHEDATWWCQEKQANKVTLPDQVRLCCVFSCGTISYIFLYTADWDI